MNKETVNLNELLTIINEHDYLSLSFVKAIEMYYENAGMVHARWKYDRVILNVNEDIKIFEENYGYKLEGDEIIDFCINSWEIHQKVEKILMKNTDKRFSDVDTYLKLFGVTKLTPKNYTLHNNEPINRELLVVENDKLTLNEEILRKQWVADVHVGDINKVNIIIGLCFARGIQNTYGFHNEIHLRRTIHEYVRYITMQ